MTNEGSNDIFNGLNGLLGSKRPSMRWSYDTNLRVIQANRNVRDLLDIPSSSEVEIDLTRVLGTEELARLRSNLEKVTLGQWTQHVHLMILGSSRIGLAVWWTTAHHIGGKFAHYETVFELVLVAWLEAWEQVAQLRDYLGLSLAELFRRVDGD